MNVYILVVDDEPDVEALFRRDLRAGRFHMEFALSAPDALKRAAEVRDPSLILILSDINMPGMSGLDMLPRVRADHPHVPVIMITAYGDIETRRKAIEGGATGLSPSRLTSRNCARRSIPGSSRRHDPDHSLRR